MSTNTCGNCGHRGVCSEADSVYGQDHPCRFDESRWIPDAEEEFFIVIHPYKDGTFPVENIIAVCVFKEMALKKAWDMSDAYPGIKVYRCLGRVVGEVVKP